MEESETGPPKLSDSWTLVSSQGDIVRADGDSDTSESSIEVVSVDGPQVVSFHLNAKEPAAITDEEKGGEIAKDACVVESKTSTAEISASCVASLISSNKDVQIAQEILRAGVSPSATDTSHGDVADSCRSVFESTPDHEDDSDVMMQTSLEVEEKNVSIADFTSEPLPSGVSPLFVKDEPNISEGKEALTADGDDLASKVDGTADIKMDDTVDDQASSQVIVQSEINQQPSGACCTELLQDDESLACEGVLSESQISSSSRATSKKGDSDTDSDFVQLDVESLEDFEVAANLEARLDGLALRPFSSIDDNFRFMGGEAARNGERPDPPLQFDPLVINLIDDNPVFVEDPADNDSDDDGVDDDNDMDRDDETESFTEEGIDDRIESDQSEAESAQDEAVDLSEFADIGDIPLVAGNVPRNYIHSPNNRLSMVLNVTLVLATILTMGISLGIIMATDLEIEEWQNAYELQTIRVKQLELQLKDKKSYTDSTDTMVAELQDLNSQLDKRLADMELKNMEYKKTQQALDWLEAHGEIEGGRFSQASQLVRGVIHVFTHCEHGFYEGDNVSAVPQGPCLDDLDGYIRKLRGLAGGESSTGFNFRGSEGEESSDGEQNLEKQHDEITEFSGKKDFETEEHGNCYKDGNNQRSANCRGIAHSQVELDIGQLQQSLSREQERALHWQSLYLFERRQREREQENEEWEDQRDRLYWEEYDRRKETTECDVPPLDEMECFKKVLTSNLSTITQYVTKWNVSVFDDFANLSTLLSSVEELKQSVVDSVHKAWDGAEKIFESASRGEGNTGSSNNDGDSTTESQPFFFGKDEAVRYLEKILENAKDKSGKHAEDFIRSFKANLIKTKEFLQSTGEEVAAIPFNKHLENALSATGETLAQVQTEIDSVLPEKEVFVESVRNALNIFNSEFEEKELHPTVVEKEMSEQETVKLDSAEPYEKFDRVGVNKEDEYIEENDQDVLENDNNANTDVDDHHNEEDYEEDDDDDDIDDNDHEEMKRSETKNREGRASWSKGIGNIWKRTHKSFKQLGRKVSNTFGEIRKIWRKKDQPLIRIAKHLTSKFVRASVKLTEICTKLPSTFFKSGRSSKETSQVFIHSKCMKRLRKQWQSRLLDNPCEAAGELSTECNMDRKALKRDVKEVSKLFSHLLRIKAFDPVGSQTVSLEDINLHHELFDSFLERWGKRHVLLKKDLEWAVCERDIWHRVLQSGKGSVMENNCDVISPSASFYPGGDIEELTHIMDKNWKKKGDNGDRVENRKFHKQKQEGKQNNEIKKNKEGPRISKRGENKKKQFNDGLLVKENETEYFDSDRHFARMRYRLQKRREREKRQAKETISVTQEQRHHQEKRRSDTASSDDDSHVEGNGMNGFEYESDFRHALHWEQERREQEKSQQWKQGANGHQSGKRKHQVVDGEFVDENFSLKRGHHREQVRRDEHRGDWFFDRSEGRQEHRQSP